MKNKQHLKVLFHLLFCTCIILFFRFNSLFRPIANGAFYKEYVAAAIVLSVFYFNFYFLYPQLYIKRRYVSYVITSFFILIVASLAEETLVFRQVFEIAQHLNINFHVYFTLQTIMLLIRDSCFFFFSFFVSTVYFLNKEKDEINQHLSSHNHLIIAKGSHNLTVTIHINDIAYCQQNANYTNIYLSNGMCYTRNCSMSVLAEDLGPLCSVRISRSVIAMFAYIQSFDEKTVYIQTHEGEKGFNITHSYRDQALAQLNAHFKDKDEMKNLAITGEKNDTFFEETKDMEIEAIQNDATQAMKKNVLKPILEYIKERPGCKSSDLTDHIHISRSTVNRTLKQLKDEGLIEYVGSKKTGGYMMVES